MSNSNSFMQQGNGLMNNNYADPSQLYMNYGNIGGQMQNNNSQYNNAGQGAGANYSNNMSTN